MAVVEISIIPIGTPSAGVSNYVAGCLKQLESEEEIKYELTPMGTIIEGELEKIFKVVRKMHEYPFNKGIERVVTNIRIDDRRDKDLTMNSKVTSVKNKI
ncbi:MAG: MTH1187 family thiamine-binding protein [Clostridiales bacterium]|nr:MTH1187 family thiamine-binding protein [Clostridiales bacterium]MCF8021465.1 MTH1187 family thiamine-binding protein [Clostridiales bacterium]